MNRTLQNIFLCLLGFLLSTGVVAHDPPVGLWYSPDHNGHGFDLQKKGDNYTVVFYTYDDQSQPIWYLSVASGSSSLLSGTFSMYEYQAVENPPQQLLRDAGDFTIDFVNTGEGTVCADASFATPDATVAVLNWNVDGVQGSWCVIPLLPQDQPSQQEFTGLWWAGEADQGWGLTLDFAGEGELRTEVAVLFYFDGTGFPRWALGATSQGGAESQIAMQNFTGYCISCPVSDISPVDAGSINHQIAMVDGDPSGILDLNVSYGLNPGGDWTRSQSMVTPLSDAVSGFIPIPERIAADQTVAILDATLVPMTEGFPIIPHRSMLIEDGVITGIHPSTGFEVPADAVIVDARGLYLAPGMSEMHLHISVGGQFAMEQAGLLMIANGITTALNMGNSYNFDVPAIGERFESGELIGPTLYAGQVAYGPDESTSAPHVVSDGPGATAYAEKLKAQGFDYIKTYWQLPTSALNQFYKESERLDLPIIGHMPLRWSMNLNLASGHHMAAHIQEPYVSFMGSSRRDELFPGAAKVFLDHGAYLTPTLAVFESYAKITGPRVQNYNELITRDGHQYQLKAIKDAWRNYYNQGYIQNGNANDLDDLLAFFYRMAKYFFEAGVPLLIGTDAPGFPGVMSGFGAHEEMRLLHETGIPADEVFAMATRNAGQFVDDTLHPEVGFGTLEPGKRADLILTRNNPMESLEHVKRPLAVMARGRFWSQAALEEELNQWIAAQKQQSLNRTDKADIEALDFSPHH